jgi:kynurenine/2-aminoadipate aminotransferase
MTLRFSSSITAKPIENYDKYLTPRSLARKPSPIRALQPLLSIPGMISLGGGMPDPNLFPFESVKIQLKPGFANVVELNVDRDEMTKALQYSATAGFPSFVEWLNKIMKHSHGRSRADWEVCVTNGSQEALSKAFEMCIKEGDYVLVDTPAYSGSLAGLRPMGCRFVEVESDKDGLDPKKLEAILDGWKGSEKPRVLYTVPNGGNPTGASISADRRFELYKVAQRHDLLILEDDPYYFLQFATLDSKNLSPSLFSMDVDGRVLRFDSFSKVLSAGIRVGWCTGPKPLMERINLHGQSFNLHPSNIGQLFCSKLLDEWQLSGFHQHVDRVQRHYFAKRNMFVEAAKKHLTGLVEYEIPEAGMFVWLKLKKVTDSSKLIKERAVEKKVLLVPGFVRTFFRWLTNRNFIRINAIPPTCEPVIQRLLMRKWTWRCSD